MSVLVSSSVNSLLSSSASVRHIKGLYRSLSSAVRELVSNAKDAGAQNVYIMFLADSRQSCGNFIVKDDGAGMTRDEVLTRFIPLGSVGEGNSDKIGEFGRGSKSLLAYVNSFIVSTVSGGVCTNFTMFYDDSEIIQSHVEDSYPVDRADGTEIVFTLKDRGLYDSLLKDLSSQYGVFDDSVHILVNWGYSHYRKYQPLGLHNVAGRERNIGIVRDSSFSGGIVLLIGGWAYHVKSELFPSEGQSLVVEVFPGEVSFNESHDDVVNTNATREFIYQVRDSVAQLVNNIVHGEVGKTSFPLFTFKNNEVFFCGITLSSDFFSSLDEVNIVDFSCNHDSSITRWKDRVSHNVNRMNMTGLLSAITREIGWSRLSDVHFISIPDGDKGVFSRVNNARLKLRNQIHHDALHLGIVKGNITEKQAKLLRLFGVHDFTVVECQPTRKDTSPKKGKELKGFYVFDRSPFDVLTQWYHFDSRASLSCSLQVSSFTEKDLVLRGALDDTIPLLKHYVKVFGIDSLKRFSRLIVADNMSATLSKTPATIILNPFKVDSKAMTYVSRSNVFSLEGVKVWDDSSFIALPEVAYDEVKKIVYDLYSSQLLEAVYPERSKKVPLRLEGLSYGGKELYRILKVNNKELSINVLRYIATCLPEADGRDVQETLRSLVVYVLFGLMGNSVVFGVTRVSDDFFTKVAQAVVDEVEFYCNELMAFREENVSSCLIKA